MRFPRASYIPKGPSNKIASKKSSAVVYLSLSTLGRFYAVAFYGKADKPSFNYSFKSADARSKYVAKWLQDMDAVAARKVARQVEKKVKLAQQQPLSVGDVLVSSWGYDQTNIDYYEVVELFGKRGVVICEIGCESVETLSLQGKSIPVKGSFIGKPMRKMVGESGSVRLTSYSWARKMEPVMIEGKPMGYRPHNWTAYA